MISTSRLKCFKSLNCSICKAPYAQTATEAKSPLQLFCGKTICRECFNRDKPLQNKSRSHQCVHGDCFHLADPFFFLIDLLSSDSFQFSTQQNGYFLKKEFTPPECPICQEDFSVIGRQRASLLLFCNHALCFDCFFKTRKKSRKFGGDFVVLCPICRREFGQVYEEVPLLREFAKEFPEMVDQMKRLGPFLSKEDEKLTEVMEKSKELSKIVKKPSEMPISSIPSSSSVVLIDLTERKERIQCANCQKQNDFDDMFHCEDCLEDICGTCGLRSHRTHKLKDFSEIEKKRMSAETIEALEFEISTYEEILPKIHSDIITNLLIFKKAIFDRAKKIETIPIYVNAKRERDSCREIGQRFESISEEYMPPLRIYSAKIQELIGKLEIEDERIKDS